MGQFKPMVKMETTEPSVELKLKKGGKVAKKADGGMMGSPMSAAGAMPPAMPARGGMMGAGSPMTPSLAMRRRAMRGMPAGAGPAGPVGGAAQMQAPMGMPAMKKGGKACGGMAEGGKTDMEQDKAMIKKAFKQHDMQEHKGGKGTSLKLKHGGKMATGGVVMGNAGGYKAGGTVKGMHTMPNGKMMKNSAMKDGGKACATGGVVNGQGGYKKGGNVKMAMGGMMDGGMMDDGMNNMPAYKKGGMPMAKKDGKMVPSFLVKTKMAKGGMACATGGVAMGNGGGYKKGGAPKKAYAAGGTVNSGRPVAMPQGQKPASKPVRINELAGTYKTGGKVTPAQGRLQKTSDAENAPAFRAAKKNTNEKYGPASMMKLKEGGDVDLSKGAYDKAIGPSEEDMDMAKTIRGIPGKLFRGAKSLMGMDKAPKSESVTKTKESVTVTPAKKRGGSVKC